MEMSKIEEAIEDFIQGHITDLDFSDMITTEVRDTWDMDELDRVDETVDRVDAIEAWIHDAEDKLSIQNVIDLENSVKNLVEHTNILQLRIRDLEDRLLDYEEIREMAWQSAHKKSFLSFLHFWK
jgi:regulator of replication initiation timing